MNYYTLSKTMDNDFLEGKIVRCPITLVLTDVESGKIRVGEKLVVMLSNGKKYMGSLVHINYTLEGQFACGTIELRRLT